MNHTDIQWQIVSRIPGEAQPAAAESPITVERSAGASVVPQYRFERVSPILTTMILLSLWIVAPFVYRYLARLDVNPDPFTYAQMGKEILQGKQLYSEIPTDKGPLMTLATAIPQIFSPRNYLALGAFLGVVLIAQSIIFVWMYRSNFPMVIAAALLIVLLPMTSSDFFWLSSEHVANLFVALNLAMAYKILRRERFSFGDCFAVGLISCLALNVRQTALLSGIVPLAACAIYAKSFSRMSKAVGFGILGGLAGFLIMLILVAAVGNVHDYLKMLLFHPATYAKAGNWSDVWRLFSDYSSSELGRLMIVTVAYTLFSRHWFVVVSAVLAGFLTCAIPRRDYDHYLVGLFPYFALLVGIALKRHTKFDRLLGCALGALLIYFCVPLAKENLFQARHAPTQLDMVTVASAIDRDAPPSASLLVWGPMGSEAIVFASHLPTANKRWILWWLDLYPYVSVAQISDEYLAHPPTVLAMNDQLLADAQSGKKNPDLQSQFELGLNLLAKHIYVQKESINGYSIRILKDRTN